MQPAAANPNLRSITRLIPADPIDQYGDGSDGHFDGRSAMEVFAELSTAGARVYWGFYKDCPESALLEYCPPVDPLESAGHYKVTWQAVKNDFYI